MDKENYLGCLIPLLIIILLINWLFSEVPIVGYVISVILLGFLCFTMIPDEIEKYKEKKSLALIKAKEEKYPVAFRVYGFSDNRSDEKWDEMEKFEKSWQARIAYVKSHYPNGYSVFCKGHNININNSSSISLTWSLSNKEEFLKISEEKWTSYDQEELKRLIEEKPKEILRLENQAKINIIANRYPNGFARWLLNNEEASNDYQKISINEPIIKNLENLCLEELLSCVQSWYSVGALKVFSMYPYYPTTCGFEVPFKHREVRTMIWDFKTGVKPYKPGRYSNSHYIFQSRPSNSNTKARDEVISNLKTVLSYFFDKKQKDLTLVCINASTKEGNICRYEDFSSELCEKTAMKNGYPHISITKDGTPKHTGGKEKAELRWNEDFFKGKFVILFDDVITKGNSMLTYKYKLEDMGANVIGGITIGKTSHTMDYSEFPINSIREKLRQRLEEEASKREWIVKSVTPVISSEKSLIKSAVVVPSQYGKSVRFNLKNGSQTFVPLYEDSKLIVGETLDISKANFLELTQDGINKIVRVDGPPLCVGPPEKLT